MFDRFPCSRLPTCCGRLRRLHLFHQSPSLAHRSVRPPTTAGHHHPRQQVGAADALLAPAIAHAGPVGLTLTDRGAGILRDHQSSESPAPKVPYQSRHGMPINYCRRIATRLSSATTFSAALSCAARAMKNCGTTSGPQRVKCAIGGPVDSIVRFAALRPFFSTPPFVYRMRVRAFPV